MRALTVLYGGNLGEPAFEKVFSGKNALVCALEQAAAFPGVEKTALLVREDFDGTALDGLEAACRKGLEVRRAPGWTRKSLLDELAALSASYEICYYAWADCPLLDPALTARVAERHRRYAAEYSYADGWPYGFAPEVLSPQTAALLAKIAAGDQGPVERDLVFSVIQKDINSFDIETEISPLDLRCHRLSLSADSRRNLLLLRRLSEAGASSAALSEKIIPQRLALLRTLPAFFPIQTSGPCPQSCRICPYPSIAPTASAASPGTGAFIEPSRFEGLLDSIIAFAGDAVIDLSLWGELALHPEKEALISMVLERPELSLIVESSGLGWEAGLLEKLAQKAAASKKRKNGLSPLSWIISLDAFSPERYREVRGQGFAEAVASARLLTRLFPKDAYVQAVRVKGFEDDIEQFYRSWKEEGANVIIQKYDDFCGFLPDLMASDLSPVQRQPCWHLMRDMPVLIDGRVPLCREDVALAGGAVGMVLGNAFTESLDSIWARGEEPYRMHCAAEYKGICAGCDEYYTYNF